MRTFLKCKTIFSKNKIFIKKNTYAKLLRSKNEIVEEIDFGKYKKQIEPIPYEKIKKKKEIVTENLDLKPSERLSKYLSHLGICSRRECAQLIKENKINVDGNIIKDTGFKVFPNQKILVNGKRIEVKEKQEAKLWIFKKARGVLCSSRDHRGRRTISELLRAMGRPNLMTVGRLDYNSEGLLLLTNDGSLSRYLELPSSKIERVYHVRVHGIVTESKLEKFHRGSNIEGVHYSKMETKILHVKKSNTWLEVKLWEGKNREIRKVFEHMKMPLSQLVRVKYGPYKMEKSMKNNEIREIPIHPSFEKYLNQNWKKYNNKEN